MGDVWTFYLSSFILFSFSFTGKRLDQAEIPPQRVVKLKQPNNHSVVLFDFSGFLSSPHLWFIIGLIRDVFFSYVDSLMG